MESRLTTTRPAPARRTMRIHSPTVPTAGTAITEGAAHPPIMLPPAPAIVTAPVGPVPARALPVTLEPDPTVMLAFAMTFPRKLTPLRVAEVPTRQNTLQGSAVPTTFEPTLAVSALFTSKTKIPGPLRVRVPRAARSAAPPVKE